MQIISTLETERSRKKTVTTTRRVFFLNVGLNPVFVFWVLDEGGGGGGGIKLATFNSMSPIIAALRSIARL